MNLLGVSCQITYPSSCPGLMRLYFFADGPVDWTANVITGLHYRVADQAISCLPDIANCVDEYSVRLDRVNL